MSAAAPPAVKAFEEAKKLLGVEPQNCTYEKALAAYYQLLLDAPHAAVPSFGDA